MLQRTHRTEQLMRKRTGSSDRTSDGLRLPAPGSFWTVFSSALSYCLLLAGLLTICLMAYNTSVAYSPLLWKDQWKFLQELVANHGHYSMQLLWKQHDDHRIPIPKLFYLIDLYVFHGRNVFLLVSIFLFQLVNLGALNALYRDVGGLSGSGLRTAIGVTAISLFWMSQTENFWFGSDLPIILPYVGATLALLNLGYYQLAFERGDTTTARRALAMLVVSGVVASLSLTNGLLLWAVLLVPMLLWRLPPRSALLVGLIGGSLIAIWAIGYTIRPPSTALSALAVARFLLVFYGSSWSPFTGETVGMAMAAVAIPGALITYIWCLIRRSGDVFGILLLSNVVFLIASSILTALGRMAWGIEQARASRYQTAAMLFWGCLLVLAIRAAGKLAPPRFAIVALQIIGLYMGFIDVKLQPYVVAGAHIVADNMKTASLPMEAGVKDTKAMLYAAPPIRPDDILLLSDYLRSRKWSIFSGSESYQLGHQFTNLFHVVSASSCRGAIDEVSPLADYRWAGFRFSGWTWDFQAHRSGKAVAWVDYASGRLIGVGPSGFSRPDVPKVIPAFNRTDTGYLGYIPSYLNSSRADAYVILADNVSACPLTSKPVDFDLASTRYSGPKPTGLTVGIIQGDLKAIGAIEMVDGAPVNKRQFSVPGGSQTIRVRGWVTASRRAGSAADIAIDGLPFATTYGLDRPDIAKFLGSPAATHCGFQATLPGGLSRGKHELTLRVVSSDQELYYESLPITLTIQ